MSARVVMATWLMLAAGAGSGMAWPASATSAAAAVPAKAPPATASKTALREMEVHRSTELKLEIWVENQPPWTTQLSTATGHPTFVAQSPDDYHPPTVMMYSTFPGEKVSDPLFQTMASSAIRRAATNFGLTVGQARGIILNPATYGVLRGYEGVFAGKAQGELLDVQIFVGQAAQRFPVVLTIYTLRGKLPNLMEQRRRAWSKVQYLGATP